LGGDGPAEVPKIFRVAAEQAFRLLGEPENPFRAALLHPKWGACEAAGEKIDSSSHANGNWNTEGAIMHVDPLFLLGATEADEEQIGLSAKNAIANLLVIHFKKLVERRGVITCDLEIGVLLLCFGNGGLDGVGRGTEEKRAVALFGSNFQEERDEI
jgi:hypothetical protein